MQLKVVKITQFLSTKSIVHCDVDIFKLTAGAQSNYRDINDPFKNLPKIV